MDEPSRRPPPDVRFEFGHEAEAAREARRALDPLLEEAPEPQADAVRLAASELVSNVVQHTDDGGSMQAWRARHEHPLRLEVEDTEPTLPEIPTTPDVTGGRGLTIVDDVAAEWGVDSTADGKVVWAEFDVTNDEQGSGPQH